MGLCCSSRSEFELLIEHLMPPWALFKPQITSTVVENCYVSWNDIILGNTQVFQIVKEKDATQSPLSFFYELFYRSLFARYPDMQHFFMNSMKVQGAVLVKVLSTITHMMRTESQKKVKKYLRDIAERHNDKGIRPDHYGLFVQCLFDCIESCLGDSFTTVIRFSWINAFSMILRVMIPVSLRGALEKMKRECKDASPDDLILLTQNYAQQQCPANSVFAAAGMEDIETCLSQRQMITSNDSTTQEGITHTNIRQESNEYGTSYDFLEEQKHDRNNHNTQTYQRSEIGIGVPVVYQPLSSEKESNMHISLKIGSEVNETMSNPSRISNNSKRVSPTEDSREVNNRTSYGIHERLVDQANDDVIMDIEPITDAFNEVIEAKNALQLHNRHSSEPIGNAGKHLGIRKRGRSQQYEMKKCASDDSSVASSMNWYQKNDEFDIRRSATFQGPEKSSRSQFKSFAPSYKKDHPHHHNRIQRSETLSS